MSYNAPEPIAVDKVTEEDLKNNFVDYLKVRSLLLNESNPK